VSEYEADLNNFKEEPPTPWTDEQYRAAFQSLVIKYHEMKAERDKFEQKLNEAYESGYQMEGRLYDMTHERNTLIDDVAILKANNDRLMRRNQKLEAYVRMWEKLTKWKQGKLAEHCNNDLLHELSYTMNELERDMYKGRG
jgi:chorismate mutase